MKLVPVIVGLTLPAAALIGCGQATPRTASAPPTSPTSAPFVMLPPSATRSQVVAAFLDAVVAGRCTESRRLFVPPPAPQDGIPTYCDAGRPVIDHWRTADWRSAKPGTNAAPDPTMPVTTEVHLISDDTGAPVPRWATRFFSLTKTAEGWRISGGGSGP